MIDFFQTTKDQEFSNFLVKDWASDDFTHTDRWRINHFVMTCLVDVFDVYDKVQKGFVDDSHLKSRISALRLGVMKTEEGKSVWNFMKINRSKEFITWFEYEIYEKEIFSDPERDEKLEGMNIIRK